MRRATLALLGFSATAVSLHGCGGVGSDNPDTCNIDLIVETAVPVAGASVVVRASSPQSGFLSTDWSLEFESSPVSCTDGLGGQCEGTSIAFLPTDAGVYDVSVSGSVDSTVCSGDSTAINVMVPGANNALYRMVVTPLAAAAVHEETVVIPGGANYDLGATRLGAPLQIAGQVRTDGTPIAAHLRVVSMSGQGATDVFASGALGYEAAVNPELLDIDVYPSDSNIPPLRLSGIDPTTLGDIDIEAGVAVSGVVRDPGGAGLSSARVSVLSEGLPSSVGTADGAGLFGLETRAGATEVVTVTPAAASGLPVLSGTAVLPSSPAALDIAYNPALIVETPRFTITEDDQATPIAGARVTFVSTELALAGSVSVDGGADAPLTGRVRRTVIADANGEIANVALSRGTYSAVVAGPARPTIAAIVVADSGASVIAAAAPATWTARIMSEGAPLAAARLTFRPLGNLELVPGASAEASTDASGVISVNLTGGGRYDLQIDGGGDFGRVHHDALTAPDGGVAIDVGTIEVAPGQRITGRVQLASGAPAGAHVAFYCTSCPIPTVPVGEALTDASGDWVMVLPDSGSKTGGRI